MIFFGKQKTLQKQVIYEKETKFDHKDATPFVSTKGFPQ
jgi:hypothetical protein